MADEIRELMKKKDEIEKEIKEYHEVLQSVGTLRLPSFTTVLHNCKAIFMRTWLNSSNSIVAYVQSILMS